jgi:hypothetical protein
MRGNDISVFRQVNVKLDTVRPLLNRESKRFKRIFGTVSGRSPVRLYTCHN